MAITVTAAQQANPANGILLRVIVWTSAAAVQNGVTVSADAVQQSAITPGQTGSVVVGAVLGSPNGTYTINGASTALDNVADATNGEQYLTCYATATSVATVAETIGFSGTNPGGVALLEVLKSGTLAQDASSPAVADNGGVFTVQTVTTAAFTPPPGSFLTALVSSDSSGLVATMLVSGGGLVWTEKVKANASGHDYAGIWTAQVPAASAAGGTAVSPGPGWHPGPGLPGMPGGTPFYAPWTGNPPAGSPALTAPASVTGGGSLTAAGHKNATDTSTITGGASLATTDKKNASDAGNLTAGGALAAAPLFTPSAASNITGGGALAAVPFSAAPSIAATWTGGRADSSGFTFPFPQARTTQISVANVAGDWMFAIITWRQATAGAGVTVSVADDAHNYWEPLGAPSGDSSAAGVTRTAIWYAPAARAASFVHIAPTGYVTSLVAIIADVAGMSKWFTLSAITPGFANAGTALSLGIGAPAASALMLAGVGTDNNGDTITGPGAGWTALTTVSVSNGVDTTADIQLHSAWQVATAGQTAAWSSSGSLDLSGVTAGILVNTAAPVAPNPSWPIVVTELDPGAGVTTPPSQTTWAPISPRNLAMTFTQGRQYTLGQLQAGQGTLLLDNPDGALIPPGTPPWQASWHGDGVTSAPGIASQVITGIVAGQQYQASALMETAQGWAGGSGGAWFQFQWNFGSWGTGPQVSVPAGIPTVVSSGLLTAPAGATSVTVVAQMTNTPPSTVIMAATAGLQPAGYLTAQPLTWSANNNATVTTLAAWTASFPGIDSGTPVRQRIIIPSSVTPYYVPFSGFFQRWPFNLEADMLRGQTAATILDVWAYAGGALTSMAREENLLDAPYAYWPCGDPAGSAAASNLATGNQKPLTVTTSKLGGGGSAQVFGANSGALPGDSSAKITASGQAGGASGTWSQTLAGTSATTNGYGYALVCTDTGYPPVANGVTVECWFGSSVAVPPGTWNMVLWSLRNVAGPVVSLVVSATTGNLIMQYKPAGGVQQSVTVNTGDWRTVGALSHVSVAFNQASYRVLIDGGNFTGASGSFSAPLAAAFTELDAGGVMGTYAAGASGYAWSGYLAHLAVFPAFLAPVRVLNHYWAAKPGMTAEAACDRIERILEYASLTGRRVLLKQQVTYEGDLCVSGQDIGGQPAASSISNIAASTVPAMMYVAPTGDMFYAAKIDQWNNPVRWTIGENTAAGEIPALATLATDYDPARVVNDIQITQLDTSAVTIPGGNAVAALETASQNQYGDVPYQVTGYLELDGSSSYTGGGGLNDLASWLAYTYAGPRNRIQSVTVDAARHPSAWNFVAGVSVGDMVTVNLRPPTAAASPLLTVTARVTQTSRTIQFSQETTTGSVTCVLDYAPEENSLICDDATRGLLNGQNKIGW